MGIWDDELEDRLFNSWFTPSRSKKNKKRNKQSKNLFKAGDTVRLVTGSSPITVTAVQGDVVRGKYVKSNYTVDRSYKQFVKFEDNMLKYKVKSTGDIGTLIEQISKSRVILEMPDGKQIVYHELEIEMLASSYTFEVTFTNSATRYAYLGDKGSVEVGDILILDGSQSFAKVVAVDTKSSRATKRFVGRKVLTSKL